MAFDVTSWREIEIEISQVTSSDHKFKSIALLYFDKSYLESYKTFLKFFLNIHNVVSIYCISHVSGSTLPKMRLNNDRSIALMR